MKATITAKPGKEAGFQHEGKIRQNRKESHFSQEWAVLVPMKDAGYDTMLDDSIMKAIITARIYAVPSRTYGTTLYACVWINSPTRKNKQSFYLTGGGKAGGCGYHKASAAFEAAFNDAGITFDEGVSGVGENAMREALAAVAVAMGYKRGRYHIHNAHA